jgi:protein subunit release factor A
VWFVFNVFMITKVIWNFNIPLDKEVGLIWWYLVQGMMGQPEVASDPAKFQLLAKEASALQDTVDKYTQYKDAQEAIVDTKQLLKECQDDEEMAEMARDEIDSLDKKIQVGF